MTKMVSRAMTLAALAALAASAAAAGPAAGGPEVTGTLIVLNKAEASASFLDCATGEEIARLPTGRGPHEVAVSPDGTVAVVADYGDRAPPGHTLTVMEMKAGEPPSVRKTIDLGYHRPHGIEYFADGRRVAVTAEQEQVVLAVDIETGEIAEYETGQRISHMLALSPGNDRVFVANIGSGTVTVVDLAAGRPLAQIETGEGAEGIDISPDGREVWVGNRAEDTLTVIDAATLEVAETVPCASFPIRVKFTPAGDRVLVSNARSGDVAVFDASSRRELRRIAMQEEAVEDPGERLFRDAFGRGPVPIGILVEPRGRVAWVANTNADIVTVIDLESWSIAGRLVAGREPDGLGYTPVKVAAGEAAP